MSEKNEVEFRWNVCVLILMTFNGSDCWTEHIIQSNSMNKRTGWKSGREKYYVCVCVSHLPFCAICVLMCVRFYDDNCVTEKFKPNYASIEIWELPWQFRHMYSKRGLSTYRSIGHRFPFTNTKKRRRTKKRAHMRHIANDIKFHISNQNALREHYDMSERTNEWVTDFVSEIPDLSSPLNTRSYTFTHTSTHTV